MLLGSTGAPGIFLDSFAHSPKSISLQRSEQKGLKVFSVRQVFFCLHVGQKIFSRLFIWFFFFSFWLVDKNGFVANYITQEVVMYGRFYKNDGFIIVQ